LCAYIPVCFCRFNRQCMYPYGLAYQIKTVAVHTCRVHATPMIKALQIAVVLGLGRFRIDRDMLMYFKLRNYKKLQSCTRTKAAMIHDRALKKSLAMTTRGSLRTTHDAK
jgi:hypothetical protein